ncbi:unnamed protein product [Paramecium sonneborni]|uniref:Protein kinase domain-containing protein n=1 Tax=Paramecium sonneborni TaxID=65129 RepID=A0A8S1NXR0_9CILI|nr:unnamed protein product [Paramecium sonneborni]
MQQNQQNNKNIIINAPNSNFPNRKFETLEQLGNGAQGQIYLAKAINWGTNDQKQYALKCQQNTQDNEIKFIDMLINYQNQYENQINIGEQNYQPSGLIRIYERFKWTQSNCTQDVLIMEKGEQNLNQFLEEKSQLKLKQKHEILIQISQSIQFIHKQQVIHRDIKSDNFIKIGNQFKLIDFGSIGRQNEQIQQTNKQIQIQVGTTQYQAPEILENIQNYTCAVDIWSLGCVFYEIFQNQCLFLGKNQKKIQQQILDCKSNAHYLTDKINQLKINDQMKKLIKQMLNPNSQLRIQINDLVQALKNMEQDQQKLPSSRSSTQTGINNQNYLEQSQQSDLQSCASFRFIICQPESQKTKQQQFQNKLQTQDFQQKEKSDIKKDNLKQSQTKKIIEDKYSQIIQQFQERQEAYQKQIDSQNKQIIEIQLQLQEKSKRLESFSVQQSQQQLQQQLLEQNQLQLQQQLDQQQQIQDRNIQKIFEQIDSQYKKQQEQYSQLQIQNKNEFQEKVQKIESSQQQQQLQQQLLEQNQLQLQQQLQQSQQIQEVNMQKGLQQFNSSCQQLQEQFFQQQIQTQNELLGKIQIINSSMQQKYDEILTQIKIVENKAIQNNDQIESFQLQLEKQAFNNKEQLQMDQNEIVNQESNSTYPNKLENISKTYNEQYQNLNEEQKDHAIIEKYKQEKEFIFKLFQLYSQNIAQELQTQIGKLNNQNKYENKQFQNEHQQLDQLNNKQQKVNQKAENILNNQENEQSQYYQLKQQNRNQTCQNQTNNQFQNQEQQLIQPDQFQSQDYQQTYDSQDQLSKFFSQSNVISRNFNRLDEQTINEYQSLFQNLTNELFNQVETLGKQIIDLKKQNQQQAYLNKEIQNLKQQKQEQIHEDQKKKKQIEELQNKLKEQNKIYNAS